MVCTRLVAAVILAAGVAAPAPAQAPESVGQLARSFEYPGSSRHTPRVLASPTQQRRAAAVGRSLPNSRESYLGFSTRDGYLKVLAYYASLAERRHLETLVDEPIDKGQGRLLIYFQDHPARVITLHVYPRYKAGAPVFVGADPPPWQRLILVDVH